MTAARTPRPPYELVGALHDRVHKDVGKSRVAKSRKRKPLARPPSVRTARKRVWSAIALMGWALWSDAQAEVTRALNVYAKAIREEARRGK